MASKAQMSGVDMEIKAGQKTGGKKVAVVIVSAVLLLGAGGGGVAWYLSGSQNRVDRTEARMPQKPPVFVSLETFTVNLYSEHSDQHLQTNLTLKVANAAVADLIKLHMPEMRNRIVLLLSSKTAPQIATAEGKKKLASELLMEIRQPFGESGPDHAVENVLFTSFIIQ